MSKLKPQEDLETKSNKFTVAEQYIRERVVTELIRNAGVHSLEFPEMRNLVNGAASVVRYILEGKV